MSKRNRQQKVSSDEDSDDDYSQHDHSSEGEDNNKKQKSSNTQQTIDPSSYYVREEDLDDEYDSDYYKDEEDRAYLDSLSELQREKILSERYEERNEKRKRKEILRKQGRLIERGKKMPTTVPASASSSSGTTLTSLPNKSSSHSTSSSSRKKSYHDPELDLELDEEEDEAPKNNKSKRGSTSTAKRVRKRSSKPSTSDDDNDLSDNQESRQQQRKHTRDDADRRSDEGDNAVEYESRSNSMRDYDQEEEEEEDEDIYESSQCKITKEDLEKILIRRSALEKEFKEPYFSESVEKAFVRVLVGYNERAQKKTYRLCQIVQVQDMSKDYPFGVNNAEKTRKGLLLQFGVQKRTWQMSAISDSKEIEENEFRAWKSEMEKVGEKFPTLKFIEHKIQQWKNLKEYKYTDKEIENMLKEKKMLKGGLIVKNKQSITREISQIKTKIKEIMDELYLRSLGKSKQNSSMMMNDEDNEDNEEDDRSERQSDESLLNEKAKYEEELKKLEAEYSKIDFLSPTAQKLGKINVKNRAMDQAAHEHRKKHQTFNALTTQGSGQLDPFSRRKTNSSFFVLATESPKEESKKEQPLPTTAFKKEEDSTKNNLVSSSSSSSSYMTQKTVSSSGLHDFDLDLTAPVEVSTANTTAVTAPPPSLLKTINTITTNAPVKKMTLAEYRKQKLKQ
ncbi:hypothetical protein FDP41_001265 [Naegleria fowleri]|uniref:Plus3 domain-containing protein n=1 Tax=Naegleria fowleri TaxID=5763 RepID=A0A6A5BR19_NAEFO|nr:uncharacterized protein FDP41_001265 [Naegleria fowleri]KAF0979597.1 hypothetical protein FDP41_001265 [Naegleria fowleri]